MCGVGGFWALRDLPDSPEAILQRMACAVEHRGPDGAGCWFDPASGVGLGHRRLAIVDLSPLGDQPMVSGSGRLVVSFNGEIYNHRALRAELEALGARFRGHSDTEVLLEGIERWGLTEMLGRAVGMFAFGLFDRESRRLFLVRDRLGEKPLYHGWVGPHFVFGSELKAIRAFPGWSGVVDRGALSLFMRHGYIPAPYSIYQGIQKLEPGCILRVERAGSSLETSIERYWSAEAAVEAGLREPYPGDESEAALDLDRLLRATIRDQMVADVPVGAFLSGGIDSSLVVALMQAESRRPVRTFTIGFHEGEYNEATFAREVAGRLGTDHTELFVTPAEVRAVIPRLPALYDEPFADSSQLPTFLVAQLARRSVTVSLSGDGGDELFGGYWRYFFGERVWRRITWAPRAVRAMGARMLRGLSPSRWDRIFKALSPLLPRRLRLQMPGDRIFKLASLLGAPSLEMFYRDLNSHWRNPAAVVLGATEPPTRLAGAIGGLAARDMVPRMMFLDSVNYLPDDILVKVDRATMGVSLESRAPMLDHRIYQFAWRLPLRFKVAGGKGKRVLRRMLARYLPPSLFERPKMGFGVPIEVWLRGPLSDWANDLLSPERLRADGYFDVERVRKVWNEHASGRRNWQYLLWDVIVFQAWLRS